MDHDSSPDTFQLNLPKDLLVEAKRHARPRLPEAQLRVEGWRSSWLSRVSELLVGKG